jgi:tripartite-type tricarboxylate transporter receptor subunit TctC
MKLLRIKPGIQPAGQLRKSSRSGWLVVASLVLWQPLTAIAAWPDKPLHIVVPFAPGGAADSAVRLMLPKLQQRLGTVVIIENRAGAGGSVGTAAVASSPADGYTLLMGSASNAIENAIKKKVPYVFDKDLAAVYLVAEVPGVVVVPAALPVYSVPELVSYVQKNSGKISYGSPGYGTSVHLAGELFQSMTASSMVHVAYKGAAPAIVDLMGQRLQLMFPALAAAQVHIQSGSLRALAVTGPQRSSLVPDLPTVSEAGIPGYEVGGWIGLFAPKGVPPDVMAKLQQAIKTVLTDAETKAAFAKIGVEPTPASAAALRDRLGSDARRWEKLISTRNIDLQ